MACLQIVRRLCNLQTFWPTLFCFDCLFTNLQVPGPPIADSWHTVYNIFKAKMAPHIAHSRHITSSRHFLKTQFELPMVILFITYETIILLYTNLSKFYVCILILEHIIIKEAKGSIDVLSFRIFI